MGRKEVARYAGNIRRAQDCVRARRISDLIMDRHVLRSQKPAESGCSASELLALQSCFSNIDAHLCSCRLWRPVTSVLHLHRLMRQARDAGEDAVVKLNFANRICKFSSGQALAHETQCSNDANAEARMHQRKPPPHTKEEFQGPNKLSENAPPMLICRIAICQVMSCILL